MDTSQQYIHMCAMAQEIQNNIPEPTTSVLNLYATGEDNVLGGLKEVWLPRQDQLTQMCLEKTEMMIATLAREFQHFIGYENQREWYEDNVIHNQIDTFEKFWLMYTMKVMFNKTWNTIEKHWELIEEQ